MNDRKEGFIIFLIACIIFTPILVCMGIKGLGALITLWGWLIVMWWLFFGKDMAKMDKYKREQEERAKTIRPIIEEKKRLYEANFQKWCEERETQRRAQGLVTDSSFKEYINSFGFEVEGTIDTGRLPTWDEYRKGIKLVYPSERVSFVNSSKVTIVTHKSMEELREMGITDIRTLLGPYFKYFSFVIRDNNGGFYCRKKQEYDIRFNLVTVDDSNNMCADVIFDLKYDKNVNVEWNSNYIYHIVREPIEKYIRKDDKESLEKWIPESIVDVNFKNISSAVRTVYYQYTIYRDSGVEVKDGSFSLTDNEKEFLKLAAINGSMVNKTYYSIADASTHYQLSPDKLTSGKLLD